MKELWLVVWNDNGKEWWETQEIPPILDQCFNSKMDLLWHLVTSLYLLPYNDSVWIRQGGNHWTNLGTIEVGTIGCPSSGA